MENMNALDLDSPFDKCTRIIKSCNTCTRVQSVVYVSSMYWDYFTDLVKLVLKTKAVFITIRVHFASHCVFFL